MEEEKINEIETITEPTTEDADDFSAEDLKEEIEAPETPAQNAGGLMVEEATETEITVEQPEVESTKEIANSTTEPTEEAIDALGTDETEQEFTAIDAGTSEAISDAPPPDTSKVGSRMDDKMRWYALHTFSGYEAVAEDNLKKVVEKYNLAERIREIFIPTEETIVEKRGKKTLVPIRTMPSYIFIKMLYGDDLWHTITRTRGITGFVGPKGRPLPLSDKEVIDMKLERKPNLNVKLDAGDTVQVIDGALAGQTAVVTAVDQAAKKCTISVSMFGRPTTVELEFALVKKM